MDFFRKFGNPGDLFPLPGSPFVPPPSFSFTFTRIDQKKITQLPSTRHMVRCRFLFFCAPAPPARRLLIFHPSSFDFGPLCARPGPCPASSNVRIFFFLPRPVGPACSFTPRFKRGGREKKISLKICLTVFRPCSQWTLASRCSRKWLVFVFLRLGRNVRWSHFRGKSCSIDFDWRKNLGRLSKYVAAIIRYVNSRIHQFTIKCFYNSEIIQKLDASFIPFALSPSSPGLNDRHKVISTLI